jgi:hypothetical protein
MNTWLSRTARLVALIGRLADANVELTDWISEKMLITCACRRMQNRFEQMTAVHRQALHLLLLFYYCSRAARWFSF